MLAYDRIGGGEPLVLIHGLGGERGVWHSAAARLAASHDVIALDLPGFGDSRALAADLEPTPLGLGESVAELVAALGLGAAHYVGNSLGGWAALELARSTPDAVLSVTALCPAGLWRHALGPRSGPSARTVARVALPLLPLVARSRALRRRVLAMTVGHPERLSAADATRIIRSYALAPAFEAANAQMRSSEPFPIETFVPEMPVTVAWGELDRMVAPVERVGWGIDVVTLADCGHLPMLDDPGLVAETILRTTGAEAAVRQATPR